jgi:hypothetical protein
MDLCVGLSILLPAFWVVFFVPAFYRVTFSATFDHLVSPYSEQTLDFHLPVCSKSKAVPLPSSLRQGEGEYGSYSFLTSAIDGVSGQRHALTALCPEERTPGTHWIGGYRKNPSPLLVIESRSPGRPVCSQTEYSSYRVVILTIIIILPTTFQRIYWYTIRVSAIKWPSSVVVKSLLYGSLFSNTTRVIIL